VSSSRTSSDGRITSNLDLSKASTGTYTIKAKCYQEDKCAEAIINIGGYHWASSSYSGKYVSKTISCHSKWSGLTKKCITDAPTYYYCKGSGDQLVYGGDTSTSNCQNNWRLVCDSSDKGSSRALCLSKAGFKDDVPRPTDWALVTDQTGTAVYQFAYEYVDYFVMLVFLVALVLFVRGALKDKENTRSMFSLKK
jgi:hypothetical protein